jgi:hypothetical protein
VKNKKQESIVASTVLKAQDIAMSCYVLIIVVTYEIRVFFEGAQKEVFSSIF